MFKNDVYKCLVRVLLGGFQKWRQFIVSSDNVFLTSTSK